jgi:cytochrome c553
MYALTSRIKRLKAQHPRLVALALGSAFLGLSMSAWAIITADADIQLVKKVEGTVIGSIGGHVTQATLTNLVKAGKNKTAFETAFEQGNNLFDHSFNTADGIGANVGVGERFTRMPRADLNGPTEWANHTPARATGPNATTCIGCHNQGGDDGAGDAAANVHRDADHTAMLNKMVTRNTPHVFGLGGLQRLAEEMTADIMKIRDDGRKQANCGKDTNAAMVTKKLSSKGVNFGNITITHAMGSMNCTETLSAPSPGAALAVSADLVVRPFQWKGSVAFIRDFARGAAHNEIGMQGSELLGSPTVDPATVDGDGDGVKNELFVGDVTSFAVYQAAQPRPTTRIELANLKIIDPLSSAEKAAIAAGSKVFDDIGCNSCHIRQLTVNNVIFREPSASKFHRDPGDLFPNGRTLLSQGLDVANPVKFDITRDQPDNADFITTNKQPLGTFQRDKQGHAVIELFGDLRRHDLGAGDAEEIDEVGTGDSTFMTENLWGVGTTRPYMHDGRSASLTEAILEHGGEGATARQNFRNLALKSQQNLIAFLNNLVLFKAEEGE